MNKKKANITREAETLAERVEALLGAHMQRETAEIENELRQEGIDPERLGQNTYTRLSEMAARRYLSLGKDVPSLLQEALRQLRPPNAEQLEEKEVSQAHSKIQEFLASIKTGVSATLHPGIPDAAFAPAFRRKKGRRLSENDREILETQQTEVDAEVRNDRKQNG